MRIDPMFWLIQALSLVFVGGLYFGGSLLFLSAFCFIALVALMIKGRSDA